MTKALWALVPAIAVLGYVGAMHKDSGRRLQITGGKTVIGFYPSLMDAYHLKATWNTDVPGDIGRSEKTYGFPINFSNLNFSLLEGRVGKFSGGSMSHKGGFKLSSGNKSIIADQFILSPSSTTNDGLQFVVDAPKDAYNPFDVEYGSPTYLFDQKQIVIGNVDLRISQRGAQELGRPELAGQLIGFMKVTGTADPVDGGGAVEPPENSGSHSMVSGLDLSLSDLRSLSYVGRVGTYPNGTVGMTLQTTSCNVGTTTIHWDAPMATTHPGIIMNLYRLSANGRFEQVGWSWVKHGFLSTNSNNCGTCQNPGTGALLGLNCSDTYGGGNNDDQFYLGGRDEWNAFTGAWTCQGSYFSNFVNDCTRRNNGSGLSVVDHRLQAADSDLGNAGARYFYEARYMNQSDINVYNNLGSRECSMTVNASNGVWTFNTIDSAETVGPAINRWGELRNFAQPQSEGDVIVAVQTTDLGGGMWHYEYAVYNSTSDRQIREFSIPVPTGATVQNIGFHDIDKDGTNDWAGSVSGNALTWTSPVFGSSNANPLKYSSIFNFRFDCNVPPATSTAGLTMFKPGTGTTQTAATKGPLVLNPVNSFQPWGVQVQSGNLASLTSSDDNRLVLVPGGIWPSSGQGVITSSTAPAGTVNTITIGVEANNNESPTNERQSIELFNWNTNAWELVDTRATTQTDSLGIVSITSNAARFINSSTREVKSRIFHYSTQALLPFSVQISFDMIGLRFD